jgi:hypothetical protein
MKVMFDVNKIDLSHIEQALKFAKDMKHKEGRLCKLDIKYPKETIFYLYWHNKASITISSQSWKK